MDIKRYVVRHLVNDLLKEIPTNVRNPALRVLVDNKLKLERLCMFMAHELHRKMIIDRKHSDIYEGQLFQLRLFLAMIDVSHEVEQPKEVKKDTILEKAQHGLRSFKDMIKRVNK